jgi:hypothetical protein
MARDGDDHGWPESANANFVVHKSFLVRQSPFFKAAFTGRFQESATKLMKLEDVSAELFELLIDWIYEKRINSDNLADIARLWILAERFLMPELQNASMRVIWKAMSKDK